MEREFEAKVRMEQRQRSSGASRTSNLRFRAPQENFTADDFGMGKLYGVGSYSKVVRATKKDTGNVYAMKIMDKKFITKENKVTFAKLERVILDQLDHPGVIRLFFTFQDNCYLYMALEPCEGGDLFEQISRKGRLSENEARFYAAEIVDALEYIHGLGLVHRDIKPENLLLTADGHIKIADFGSVKPISNSKITVLPDLLNDKSCTFVGTAAYVPPEVLSSSPSLSQKKSSPATYGNDLWALGCTLYQMLSGTSPFKDTSDWLIFQRIIARDLRFPDYFSDEASDLIDKLLDVDPSKRLGAGLDGYAALKFHPFFKGIGWKNLRASSPPQLAQESDVGNGDGTQSNVHNTSQIREYSISQNTVHDGNGGTTSSSSSDPQTNNVSKLVSIDSFDSKWQDFLEYGETIVMTSTVKKLHKLRSKKVQLILTDKPRLICVDPNRLERRKILWCDSPVEVTIQVVNNSLFKICLPKKVRSFEDAKERAWQWKKAIEGLVRQ
ncbi:3-phosphoinositide-dependent protein kinase 1-like [Iris pallida]|uniref:non-specific serine/threonine protein kinase n=1 Tax=Iris pallida TaxID=29817 RepID=A0AAX6FLL3_IRIPA|nr:3-phosphoinositide-dependent protein kinase 1-like [Iris pallida]